MGGPLRRNGRRLPRHAPRLGGHPRVAAALPGFRRLTRPILLSPGQGPIPLSGVPPCRPNASGAAGSGTTAAPGPSTCFRGRARMTQPPRANSGIRWPPSPHPPASTAGSAEWILTVLEVIRPLAASLPAAVRRLATPPAGRGQLQRPGNRLDAHAALLLRRASPHRPPSLLSQFLSHSPLSVTVLRRPPQSCSGRSRTVADAGERWSALLESVLGATPQEFESPILRHL